MSAKQKFILAIFLIVGIFSELFVPMVFTATIENKLAEITKADKMSVSTSTVPAIRYFAGCVDNLEATAPEAMLGELRANELELVGKGIKVDMSKLISGNGFNISSYERIDFHGKVYEKALAELIELKLKKVEKAQVKLTKEKVTAEAMVGISGKKKKLYIEGNLIPEGNAIFLRLTHCRLERVKIDKNFAKALFGEIKLVDFDRLHLPVKLNTLDIRDGEAVLTFIQK